MRDYRLGDWIQLTSRSVDEQDDAEAGRKGDVGHVVGPEESDGWANVYFERTGRVNLCYPEQLLFLGDAETGRHPEKKERTHVSLN